MTKTIADLPIWETEQPERHDVELTRREVQVINHLRSIKNDDDYVAMMDMIEAMVEFKNRQTKSNSQT